MPKINYSIERARKKLSDEIRDIKFDKAQESKELTELLQYQRTFSENSCQFGV